MKRIAVFASGNGSNFEKITEAAKEGRIPDCEVVLCVCDRPGAYVTQRAARHGVPVLEFSPRDFESKRDFERLIADRMDELAVDLVCLAGYMRIIGDELLNRYHGRIINLHPALLPAFPGAHSIRDAFEYGVKVFGITIHYVDETLDGGKIIAQKAIPYDGKEIAELEDMIHTEEHRLYPEVIARLLKNELN